MKAEFESVLVKIGPVSLRLPIHVDRELTAEIAQTVEDKYIEIEEEGGKVNTLHFAIRAAYEFAAELYDLQEKYREEEREYGKAFEHIATQLKEMENKFHIAPLPEENDSPREG